MNELKLTPIAYIHTGFSEKFGIPRQSGLAPDAFGVIEFVPAYRHPDALRGLEAYSHLWLIWDFSKNHRAGWSATVTPPRLGGKEHVGVFATRSPFRPNPLGLSCVKLERVEQTADAGGILHVSGVDLLDQTPIYDIKPYLPYADAHPEADGGFSAAFSERMLQVEFPGELEEKLPPQIRGAVRDILACDPRTAYIHDPERVWGVSYAGYNIRFTVRGEICRVVEIRNGSEFRTRV